MRRTINTLLILLMLSLAPGPVLPDYQALRATEETAEESHHH